jgi:pimeloyl-ACP methyl ester carboxylesterase
MKAQTLRILGATLYYEMRGSGPTLLLIAGGNGDAGIFERVAGILATDYTVVTYDPRGNSRSRLDGPPEDQRIEVHSDDARRLLQSVADSPAYVFGSSSGAIVGLDLVARHPKLVSKLVAHEPPMVEVLPDVATWRAFFDDVYDTYRRKGVGPALQKFAAGVGLDVRSDLAGSELPLDVAAMINRMAGNLDFFLSHEVRQFTRYVPDLPALDANQDRIVLAGGRDSREHLPYRPAALLAERFGTQLVDFPGDHIGYATQPVEFAAKLRDVLSSSSTRARFG